MRQSQKIALASFILSLILIQPLRLAVGSGASCMMIKYDDGEADYLWSDYYPNGVAVRFTPAALPWKITAALLYGFIINKGERYFIIEARDCDFNLVFKSSYNASEYFGNATLEWARVPLPNVTVRGGFYVSVYPMLEPEGTQLWIGIDNDTSCGRSFLVDGYKEKIVKGWETKQGKGNVMMRVEGEQANGFVEAPLDSISIAEDGIELSFRVSATSNVSEVKAALQLGSTVEGCEVNYKKGRYGVKIDWAKILRLTEPAKLTMNIKTSDSMTASTVRISSILLSKYLELEDENVRLRAALNSSKPERELLERKIENKDLDMAALNASLKIYEKRWLDEAQKAEGLDKELDELNDQVNIFKVSTALFVISTASLLVLALRWRSRFDSTRNEMVRIIKGGERRRSRRR